MDTRQQLRALWASRWWLVLFAVVAGIAAYVVSSMLPATYRARALAQIIPGPQASGFALSTDQLLQTTNFYAELGKTTRIVDAARRTGGFSEPLFGKVEVAAEPDLLVLSISGRSESPKRAAAYANAYAAAFSREVADVQESERRRVIARPQRRVAEIQEQLSTVPRDSAEFAALEAELQALQQRLADEVLSPADTVRIIQPAIAPQEPISPRPTRDAILAALVALALGATVLLVRQAFTERYRSAEEAAVDLGLAVLAELPVAAPHQPQALEAFRKLRAQVEFSLAADRAGVSPRRTDDEKGRRHALLITSPEPGAGKTYVCSNLAAALAADGHAVAAVDGDLRRPTLHKVLGVSQWPGLGDVLTNGRVHDLERFVTPVAVRETVRERGGSLGALPAGQLAEDTAERLSSAAMTLAIDELSDDYDFVVLDSPPVLAVVDAVVLSRYVNGVVLVVDARRSRRRSVRRAVQTLRAINAPILGLVLNRSELTDGEYAYYGAYPSGLLDEGESRT